MVWVSHSDFPQSLLSRSLHHSSQDDNLRLIKPAVFKTSVHNQPSSDCLVTYVSVRLHDFHVSHSSCTYLCSLSGSLENSIIITIISLTWTLVSTQVSTASNLSVCLHLPSLFGISDRYSTGLTQASSPCSPPSC